MSWDIGNGREEIRGDQRYYNDGEYHYVTFVRDGKTATIRVDDYPSTTKTSSGEFCYLTLKMLIRSYLLNLPKDKVVILQMFVVMTLGFLQKWSICHHKPVSKSIVND